MTRFARASGSKASNQRVPEDSTPWYELKQQVTDNKHNAEETHENETDWKSVIDSEKKIEENKNSVWCEFDEVKPKEKIKNKVKKNHNLDSNKLEKPDEDNSVSSSTKKGKRKPSLSHENPANDNLKSGLKNIKSKLKLSSNKTNFQVEELDCNDDCKNESSVVNDRSPKKKKNKRKFSESQDVVESSSETVEEINQTTGPNEIAVSDGSYEKKNKSFIKNKTITGRKRNKEDSPYKRRKLDEGDVKLDINGQEIWVTRLDGFYIKKDDAERIRELEKDLLKRGVSKQEVRAVIKKERRNAEKSLARLKKKVCYHCRKGGHTLSSCPMLEHSGAQLVGSGICYKCGSTEHTHFQCKVNTGNSYKFATCFVCKQEGHISKQCPDNPRGVYPSGGGCRLCGDVTHFRRECPTLQEKSNKVTVGLIDQDIETLDGQASVPRSKEPANKRKNKIVKFS